MLSGINTDIQHKGEVWHVQTEDGGPGNPIITTLLFKGGAIFSSKRTNYGEILQTASYQDVVKELMKEQHKNMVRDLASGKFERPASEAPVKKSEPESARKAVEPSPPPNKAAASVQEGTARLKEPPPKADPAKADPKRPAQKKSLDDLILDYLSKKEETLD